MELTHCTMQIFEVTETNEGAAICTTVVVALFNGRR
jgi:hypothetical protein